MHLRLIKIVVMFKLLHAYCNKNNFFCSDLDSFNNTGIKHCYLNYHSKTAMFQRSLLSKIPIVSLEDLITIIIVKIVEMIILVC